MVDYCEYCGREIGGGIDWEAICELSKEDSDLGRMVRFRLEEMGEGLRQDIQLWMDREDSEGGRVIQFTRYRPLGEVR